MLFWECFTDSTSSFCILSSTNSYWEFTCHLSTEVVLVKVPMISTSPRLSCAHNSTDTVDFPPPFSTYQLNCLFSRHIYYFNPSHKILKCLSMSFKTKWKPFPLTSIIFHDLDLSNLIFYHALLAYYNPSSHTVFFQNFEHLKLIPILDWLVSLLTILFLHIMADSWHPSQFKCLLLREASLIK